MYVLPGSHKAGNIEVQARDADHHQLGQSSDWMPNLTAKLRYSLSRDIVADLVSQHGMAALKGPAGSVLFFHSQLVHGSSNNLSPFDRAMIIITFCSIDNIPSHQGRRRPEFLVSTKYEPIVPIDEAEFVI